MEESHTTDDDTSVFSSLTDHAKDYFQAKIEYYKLAIIEKAANAAAFTATRIVLVIFGFLFLIFISISAALGIGSLLNSPTLGFLIIAGVYLLLCVIIFFFLKKKIESSVINAVIKASANKKEEEEIES